MSETTFFEIDAEIFRIQRRPGHDEIVANDGLLGLQIIDVARGTTLSRFQFADGFTDGGTFDGWCIRADGDAAVVFNDDARTACWFSFRDRSVSLLEHPSWPITINTPYDWRGDTLWLKDPDSFQFGAIRHAEGCAVFKELDGHELLQGNREWRRALDRLRRTDGRCMRTQPDRARLLYAVPAPTSTFGMIGWVDEPEISCQSTATGHRLVLTDDRRFVLLNEYEATVIDERGAVLTRLAAPSGYQFVDLDVVAGPVVVLAAMALDGRTTTRFIRHSI
jgi:hypothetical protein